MEYVRLVIRFFFFALVLLWYFFTAIIIVTLNGFSFDQSRQTLTKLISMTCSLGLKIFNITVVVDGELPKGRESFLIVSNHLSYIDIFAISSIAPTSFVTSHEMRKTPFLGHLCQFGGCLFVDRKNRRNLGAEVVELASALKNNIIVTIFPEATSTNGEAVKTFRKPLLQAAINANVPIVPMCLNYEKLDGKPITLANRDKVFWYGDFPFFSHAVELFKHRELIVRVKILSLVRTTETDKHDLALKTHELISAHYKQIIS